jgi:hypothetical protein
VDAFVVAIRDLAVWNLQRNGNHYRIAGHAKIIQRVGHVNGASHKARRNRRGEVLKVFGRPHSAEMKIERCEFVRIGRNSANRSGQRRPIGIGEPIGLAPAVHHFADAPARSRYMEERILFIRVARQVIFAGAARADEFQLDVVAEFIAVANSPKFPRVGRRRTPALPHRPIVGSTGWMRFDFVRGAPQNVKHGRGRSSSPPLPKQSVHWHRRRGDNVLP